MLSNVCMVTGSRSTLRLPILNLDEVSDINHPAPYTPEWLYWEELVLCSKESSPFI
jgi:hypothetical protein